MNDRCRDVYRNQAAAYDRLVDAEDCEGRLLPALQDIHPLAGARVAEVGVGTGRITRLLLQGGCRHVLGVEPAEAMLRVADERLVALFQPERWRLVPGSAEAIPSDDAGVDLAIAGWVFGHLTHWEPARWEGLLATGLAEMARVTRPGGTIVIIETLGTGALEPAAPNAALGAYYRHLEQDRGFRRGVISTDYQFGSSEEAARACGFFFGEELVERIRRESWDRVPEWTGIWWRRVGAPGSG